VVAADCAISIVVGQEDRVVALLRLSDDPLLVRLGDRRERVLTALDGAGSAIFNLPNEVRAYREHLARCDVPAGALVAARDELVERLHVGWQRSAIDPKLDGAWIGLLVRYEAICDALDPPAASRRLAIMEGKYYVAMARIPTPAPPATPRATVSA
jgi:hypothetical protein